MPQQPSSEKRVKPRTTIRLRVDARLVQEHERDAILAGQGFPDLENEALALSRPRHGHRRCESRDASASGLRLNVDGIGVVEPGKALSLDVHLPGDHRVVRLLGDVMWVGIQGQETVAGLRIAALDEEGFERYRVMI